MFVYFVLFIGEKLYFILIENTSFWKINIEKILPRTDKVIYHAGRKRMSVAGSSDSVRILLKVAAISSCH